ncbi:universal stress protein [Streptomyces sp. NPDC058644]|uniref:universal stress protein n=1 Tax=unclassified Streptomyces TaxID=2593676 RepID=UPI003665DE37
MERVIVAGVDRSARSRVAADWAAREALLRGCALRVVHVSARGGPDGAGQWPYRPETAADRVRERLTARHPDLRSESLRLAGRAARALCARSEDAAMIVLGLRGEGGHAGLSPGTTASGVAGAADRPVVLVPSGLACEGPAHRPDKITVGVDAHDPAGGAIDFAFDAAGRRGVRLHALHAWTLPPSAADWPFGVPEAERATWEDQEVQLLADALRPWLEKYPEARVLEDVVLLPPPQYPSGPVVLCTGCIRLCAGPLGQRARVTRRTAPP